MEPEGSVKKSSVILYNSTTIILNAIIIIVAFLMLFSYLKITNRLSDYLSNKNYSFSELVENENDDESYETFVYLIRLLVFLCVWIIPPGLIVLLAWMTIRKNIMHRRERYKSINSQKRNFGKKISYEKRISSISATAALDINEAFEKARISYMSGNFQDSINEFNKIINSYSHDKAFFYRAVAYYKLGNKKQALHDLKVAAILGHKKTQKILSSKGISWEII